MKTIKNITVGEYFSKEGLTEYDVYVDTLKPKNYFAGREGNYSSLTYDQVEVIKNILNNPNLDDIKDVFILIYRIPDRYGKSATETFLEQSIFDLFRAKTYLHNYITTLIKREKEHLSGVPDDKMLMVNASERLGAVGHLLTKIRLAKSFNTTPSDIGKWKYSQVFSILVAEKRYEDVQKDYNDIK